ncbi:hypothetical protein BAE44_0004033, partial [Dichanthelium oligosanthes]
LGRALRLRWLWLSKVHELLTRSILPVHVDSITQAFFNASIRCEVGDGLSTLFWSDPWLDGQCLATSMPELVDVVPAQRRSRRTVASALQGQAWISDLIDPLTVPVIIQFLQLRQRLQGTVLDPTHQDGVVWKWCPSGQYSCSSAYQAFFLGQSALLGAKELWKVKVPNEFRFFFWLAIQDRCWTSDRLHRHGIQSNDSCALCCQHTETIDHLLLQCVYSREVWLKTLRRSSWQQLSPSPVDRLPGWWLHSRKLVAKARRKIFDSLCLLLTRHFWLERNNRVFRDANRLPGFLVDVIFDCSFLWARAGLLDRSCLLGD